MRRVAMDQHRQHLVALARRRAGAGARAREPSTTGLTISRCDGLNASVRCIGPPGVDDVRRKSLVVLDVARRQSPAPFLPSNSENRSAGILPSVLTSTLSRPRCAMPITISCTPADAGVLDQVVEHRDQRVAAFAREALLADVLRVQVALERLRGGQALEDVPLLLRRVGRRASESARGAAGRSAWSACPRCTCTRRRACGSRCPCSAAMRSRSRIRAGPALNEPTSNSVSMSASVKPYVRRSRSGMYAALLALQRIEVGVEHAERAELADEPQHEHLLVHRRRVDHRAGDLAALGRARRTSRSTGACATSRGVAAQLVEVARASPAAHRRRDRRGSARTAPR